METVLKAISDWIKSLLTASIMSNLSGLFDDVNTQVGNIAQQVGTKPSSFEPRVFAMIEALSRNVVLPIAGVILTFIACYELIQLIAEHNNMVQFEPALLMKVKSKVAFNLTKRQLLCFGTAALIGVPLFFVLRDTAGNSGATLGMMVVMLPMFFLAMYQKNGQPAEKILRYYLQAHFVRPKVRPYQTNNYYSILMKGDDAHDSVSEKE